MFAYPVDLTPDANDAGESSVLVTAPDLPGFVTYGDDAEAALRWARDALVVWAAQRMDARQDMPHASPAAGRPVVQMPIGAALKVLVHQAMRADRVTQVELARRLGRDPKTVRRILDFEHASPPDQLEAALIALGRRTVVYVEPVKPAA